MYVVYTAVCGIHPCWGSIGLLFGTLFFSWWKRLACFINRAQVKWSLISIPDWNLRPILLGTSVRTRLDVMPIFGTPSPDIFKIRSHDRIWPQGRRRLAIRVFFLLLDGMSTIANKIHLPDLSITSIAYHLYHPFWVYPFKEDGSLQFKENILVLFSLQKQFWTYPLNVKVLYSFTKSWMLSV